MSKTAEEIIALAIPCPHDSTDSFHAMAEVKKGKTIWKVKIIRV